MGWETQPWDDNMDDNMDDQCWMTGDGARMTDDLHG